MKWNKWSATQKKVTQTLNHRFNTLFRMHHQQISRFFDSLSRSQCQFQSHLKDLGWPVEYFDSITCKKQVNNTVHSREGIQIWPGDQKKMERQARQMKAKEAKESNQEIPSRIARISPCIIYLPPSAITNILYISVKNQKRIQNIEVTIYDLSW